MGQTSSNAPTWPRPPWMCQADGSHRFVQSMLGGQYFICLDCSHTVAVDGVSGLRSHYPRCTIVATIDRGYLQKHFNRPSRWERFKRALKIALFPPAEHTSDESQWS